MSNNMRTASRATYWRGTGAGLAWISVCGVLFAAGVSKALNFALFVRYLDSVTTLPKGLTPWLALGIVGFELIVPTTSLVKGWLSRAALACAALFLCFALFHAVRVWTGDFLPCSCFGALTPLIAGWALVLDGCLALLAIAVLRSSVSTPPPPRIGFGVRFAWTVAIVLVAVWQLRVTLPVHPGAGRYRELSLNANVARSFMPSQRPKIIVFGDYACPYTQRLVESITFDRLKKDKTVDVEWKELPLTRLHPTAMSLAVASVNARAAGALWRTQPSLILDARSGIVPPRGQSCLAEQEALQRIRTDLRLAETLRIDHTPAILLIRAGRVFEVSDLKTAMELLTQAATDAARRIE